MTNTVMPVSHGVLGIVAVLGCCYSGMRGINSAGLPVLPGWYQQHAKCIPLQGWPAFWPAFLSAMLPRHWKTLPATLTSLDNRPLFIHLVG
jgi:hypothetical protein